MLDKDRGRLPKEENIPIKISSGLASKRSRVVYNYDKTVDSKGVIPKIKGSEGEFRLGRTDSELLRDLNQVLKGLTDLSNCL